MPKSLLSYCQGLLSKITLVEDQSFYWSPATKTIHYDPKTLKTAAGQWALVHEVAHAQLGHKDYTSDLALLKLEVSAWQSAQEIAKNYGIPIDPDHIEDCLDTYRDWLYARSTCPTCSLNSLQVESNTYLCTNCSTRWSVSRSRFCRPYRMSKALGNETLRSDISKNAQPKTTRF